MPDARGWESSYWHLLCPTDAKRRKIRSQCCKGAGAPSQGYLYGLMSYFEELRQAALRLGRKIFSMQCSGDQWIVLSTTEYFFGMVPAPSEHVVHDLSTMTCSLRSTFSVVWDEIHTLLLKLEHHWVLLRCTAYPQSNYTPSHGPLHPSERRRLCAQECCKPYPPPVVLRRSSCC